MTNQDVGDLTATALECLHPAKMIDGFPIATYVDCPSVNLPQSWYFSSNCDHGRVACKWLGGEVEISSEHPMSFPAPSFYEEMSRVNQ